ncbi:GGDEF domain-containing protein [Motilibacter rhizosphaerae]|uniref:GGDEF domain-containing protein n=1 Tax=Motilibacter rhizosphaerae TaxID=598652 RepID=UPI00102B74B7|nr:GGDEF domain-containing protein [Motilibacter rhizosphaerae]
MLAFLLADLVDRHRRLRQTEQDAAETDPLTGLANRRRLDGCLAVLQPGDTLVMLDLDHFKQLNDTHGHEVGDAVLADFGAVLQGALRNGDTAVRYGGEEFLLLLPATSLDGARLVTDRLRSAWSAARPDSTFPTGIALHQGSDRPQHTLRRADQALYEAKRRGRNQTVTA